MSVFWHNVDRLKQGKEIVDVSLFSGSFCLPPYLGFKDGDTIYILAFLSRKAIQGIYKDVKKNFAALVHDIVNRRGEE